LFDAGDRRSRRTPRAAVVWYRSRRTAGSWSTALTPAGLVNLRHDGRVALSVIDPGDGYRWVGMSGVVERVDDDQAIAQADIAGLARTYHAADPAKAERLIEGRFQRQHRVSFRIRPTAIHDHLE
jgi:hypothetical protein